MDSATTTAAGEKPIIFQAMTRDVETMVLRNIWLIIRSTPQKGIFEIGLPEDKERFRSALLGTSSIFVKSSLYAVGGRKPNSDELSSCIRYLDTNKRFEGWKGGTLPSPSIDSVLGVYNDSIYILPGMWKYGYYGMDCEEQKGYIWNAIGNCLEMEILPPEDGGTRQWRRIRACASLDKVGLLIAMDGENNFFFNNQENNDWKIYNIEDPLPKFIGETSFAASNGRLYILEVRSMSPAFLYIYDIEKRKLVMDKRPIPEFDDDLWSMDEWDRVVRLVPVADDKLCFLWLGPVTYENENMWYRVRILHYLKVKFSINPNPCKSEVKVEDDKVFHTNITNLLDCLPCSYPEQFEAELEDRSPLYPLLDAFQKQREEKSSAEEIETSLISGEPFQDQAEDIASPKDEGRGKRKRTQLVDPLSRLEQKRAKDRVWRSKRKTQVSIELKKKLEQSETDNMVLKYEAQVTKAQLEGKIREAQLEGKIREAQLEVRKAELEVREAKLVPKIREAQLEAEVRALEAEVRVLKVEVREALKAEERKAELEAEVRDLRAEVRVLRAEVGEARLRGQISEAEKQHITFDKLQGLHRGERGKNEEPSSTLYETVSPSAVPKQQHETGALAAFPQLKQETGAPAAFPQFKQETDAPAAFPQFKQETGAPAAFRQSKRETGAPAAFHQSKRETGASAAFPQFKQETGAPAAFPQFKQETGAPAAFRQSKRETGASAAFPQFKQETGTPAAFHQSKRETGASAAFPQFKQETGASAAFPQFKQETGASAAFPQFKQETGASAAFPQFKQETDASAAFPQFKQETGAPAAFRQSKQAEMDQFGGNGSLDDNVESFSSNESQGFSFMEVHHVQASPSKLTCCDFSSDGKLLASGGHDKRAVVFFTDTMKPKSTLEEHLSLITDVRFSPSMLRLATSSFDKTVKVWDVDNPGYSFQTFVGHSATVMSLDFHPNRDDLICSCDSNGEIRYWSINNASCARVFRGCTVHLRFQPRLGKYLAAAAENVVSILDVETQALRHSLQGHSKPIHSICWDPSGEFLASVSEDSVRVWTFGSGSEGACIHDLSSNGNRFHCCVFHPTYSSSLLVIGCYRSLELWNMLENKTMALTAHEGLIAALAVSSATGLIASASHDKCVKLWK